MRKYFTLVLLLSFASALLYAGEKIAPPARPQLQKENPKIKNSIKPAASPAAPVQKKTGSKNTPVRTYGELLKK